MRKLTFTFVGFFAMNCFFVACGQSDQTKSKLANHRSRQSQNRANRVKNADGSIVNFDQDTQTFVTEDFKTEKQAITEDLAQTSVKLKTDNNTQAFSDKPLSGDALQQISGANSEITLNSKYIKLNLALSLNCGTSKNDLCQKTSDIQTQFGSSVLASSTVWSNISTAAIGNQYANYSAIQKINAPLKDILDETITNLTGKQQNLSQVQPHMVFETSTGNLKNRTTLSCKLYNDQTSQYKDTLQASNDYILMTSSTAKTFEDAAALSQTVKTKSFEVRKDTTTVHCDATSAHSVQGYQTLIQSTLTLVFGTSTAALKNAKPDDQQIEQDKQDDSTNAAVTRVSRAIASFDAETLHGKLQNRAWEYKSARVHKVIIEKENFLVLEIFNKDVPKNEICKFKVTKQVHGIQFQIPLENKEINSHNQMVLHIDDAQVTTSLRSPSSQEYYFNLTLDQAQLNETQLNNVSGVLKMQNGINGTDLRGAFVAQVCHD